MGFGADVGVERFDVDVDGAEHRRHLVHDAGPVLADEAEEDLFATTTAWRIERGGDTDFQASDPQTLGVDAQ